jgi:hypothetical protein
VTRSTDTVTLMLYDFKSQAWSRIVENTYVGDMNWSSDGRYLHYSRRGSDPASVRIRLLDGAIEQVCRPQGSATNRFPQRILDGPHSERLTFGAARYWN